MKYFVLVMLLSSGPVLAETEKPIVEPGWIYCMGPETGKARMCRMFRVDGPIPRIGEITQTDLGNVTAADLVKTPAQPLPADQSVMELLNDN